MKWLIAIFVLLTPVSHTSAQSTSKTLTLLKHEDVRNEILLTDEQEQEIEKLVRQQTKRQKDLHRGLIGHSEDKVLVAEIVSEPSEVSKDNEIAIEKILLPHQVRRISQLAIRKEVQRNGGGLVNLIEYKNLQKSLSLTSRQVEMLRKKLNVELGEIVVIVTHSKAPSFAALNVTNTWLLRPFSGSSLASPRQLPI